MYLMGQDSHYFSSSKQIDLISMFCQYTLLCSFGAVPCCTRFTVCSPIASRGALDISVKIDDLSFDAPVSSSFSGFHYILLILEHYGT